MVFHMRWLDCSWYGVFMKEQSNAPPGSEDYIDFYETPLLEFCVEFTKTALNCALQCAYMASLCDGTVFCFCKRVVGAGIANFVARTLVLLSPLVAD